MTILSFSSGLLTHAIAVQRTNRTKTENKKKKRRHPESDIDNDDTGSVFLTYAHEKCKEMKHYVKYCLIAASATSFREPNRKSPTIRRRRKKQKKTSGTSEVNIGKVNSLIEK